MSARDQGPGPKDPRAQASLEADDDDSDGAADQTTVYRPVTADMAAQRLAMKEQLSELTKLAYGVPTKPPAAGTRASAPAPPAIASAPVPGAARLPAIAALPIADRTQQLAPIAPAFAAALAAPVEGPFARVRWAIALSTLSFALPVGLLLCPAPAPKPPVVHVAEPAPPAPIPSPVASQRAIPELVTPPVSVSVPRPGRHARGASAKPSASELESNPSPPHPTQTFER
jgi:hypothetical protein